MTTFTPLPEYGEPTTEFSLIDDKYLRALLVPYDEVGKNANGDHVFSAATLVELPQLPAEVVLKLAHDGTGSTQIAADAFAFRETDKGIVADFLPRDNIYGQRLLEDHKAGRKKSISPEFKGLVRDGVNVVRARLSGAAAVVLGGFPSAAFFSLAEVDEVTETPEETIARLEAELAAAKATAPDEAPATQTTDVAPAAEATQPDAPATTQEEDVTVATVPNTTGATTSAPTPTTIAEIAFALAVYSARGDRSALDAIVEHDRPMGETGMFALNDIKLTTSGSVGVNIQQPQWIGELWRGRSYQRRIIPLIAHADLTSFTVKGFRWLVEPAMAAWAGDKAAVPTNTPTTEPYTLTALRWAGGHDIAREYRDFDVPEFWAAYFAAMTDSYAKLTDDDALAKLVAGATAVTAGAVPSGVNAGLVTIVDGALAVLPTGVPSFAVVAPDIFRSIMLMKDVDKLAYLNTSLGLEDGTIQSFRVVPHPSIATGKALVGVKAAATEYELPGSPIRTEALDQIKGGIDEALFGYSATAINRPAGLALVTPAS